MGYKTFWRVPIETWISIEWTQTARSMSLLVKYSSKTGDVILKADHTFGSSLQYLDTEGRFFIGGSQASPGQSLK